jgi:hypothetical protein
LGEISPDEFKNFIGDYSFDPVMMDKTHRSNNCYLLHGKKYARPTRIYHQEFEGGVGRD